MVGQSTPTRSGWRQRFREKPDREVRLGLDGQAVAPELVWPKNTATREL